MEIPAEGTAVSVETRAGQTLAGRVLLVEDGLLALAEALLPPNWDALPPPARPAPRHRVALVRVADVMRVTPDLDARDYPLPNLAAAGARPERLARREALAVSQRQLLLRAPPSLADADRALLSALAKTLPCAWHPARPGVLVVLDEVAVAPPYCPEACAGGARPGSAALLERVRKVLAAERLRLGMDA